MYASDEKGGITVSMSRKRIFEIIEKSDGNGRKCP